MIYGCIGERLGHSFSREIHELLGYEYELCEIPREGLEAFFSSPDFSAINVTIPYKESVIPYLAEMDSAARRIGAVNTVVNRRGRLYGFNTDFFGMAALIRHAGISLSGKKIAILGTGGTAKTARAVAESLSAKEILFVSRTPSGEEIGYGDLYESHADIEIIINTTPVGMYPRGGTSPVDISRFSALSGVIDAVYNPIRTRLILDAIARGIPAEGGLYMLVAQAVRASEIFLDKTYPEGTAEKIYRRLLTEKESIVLIGMPSAGKSTVGKILAERLSRTLLDTDDIAAALAGKPVPEIIGELGEDGFRELESRAVKDAAEKSGAVIATGGGAILREENTSALRSNGRIYFIDRPLAALTPTADRPLTSNPADLQEKYRERYPKYLAACDVRIPANSTAEEVANRILEDFCK